MKGTLGPNDYRESSTGFSFEIHKGCAGNGLSGAFEVAVLLGTSGRLRTALQTRRAQLALKGGPAKLRGQALLFSLVLIHPKLWDAHLCLALVGGRAGRGGVFLFVFLRVELQRILTPKNQCCLINSGLVLSPAITAGSHNS